MRPERSLQFRPILAQISAHGRTVRKMPKTHLTLMCMPGVVLPVWCGGHVHGWLQGAVVSDPSGVVDVNST